MSTQNNTQQIDVAQPDDAQFAITDLAPTARALVALKSTQTEQDLLAMAAKHAGLVEIKDKAGREQVHGAAMELMRARTTVKKLADEVRDDAKKFNSAVIAEEKRLTAIVEPEEQRLKALRDAYDTEQERIKREAEERERQRVLALGARIQEIRKYARLAQDCRGSESLRRVVLAGLQATDMTGFDEFEAEAAQAYTETLAQVEAVLASRLAAEAEAARLKAEAEELARQRAEGARVAAEREAAQKAEAEKLEAARAEFARQQQEAADKLAAQQAEIERQRAEIEAAKSPAPDATNTAATPFPVIDADLVAAAPDFCCEQGEVQDLNGVPCQDCADTSAAYSADMQPVRGADLVDTAAAPASNTFATPSADRLVYAIASTWGVDAETACQWLCERAAEFEVWAPAVAEVA